MQFPIFFFRSLLGNSLKTADAQFTQKRRGFVCGAGQRIFTGLHGALEIARIHTGKIDSPQQPAGAPGVGDAFFGQGRLSPAAVFARQIGFALAVTDHIQIHKVTSWFKRRDDAFSVI